MWITELKSDFIKGTDKIGLEEKLGYLFEPRQLELWVPVDFDSDGLSIPKFLWFILGSPFQPHARRAAVLHDYLYRIGYNRMLADKIFLYALIDEGCPMWKAIAFYLGVRLFGWFAWINKKKKGVCCEN